MERVPYPFLATSVLFLALGCASGPQAAEQKQRRSQELYREGVGVYQEGLAEAKAQQTPLEENDKFREALELFRKAVELNPDYIRLRYDLGVALFTEGDAYAIRGSAKFAQADEQTQQGHTEPAERARKQGRDYHVRSQERFREAETHLRRVLQETSLEFTIRADALFKVAACCVFVEPPQGQLLLRLEEGLGFAKQARDLGHGHDDATLKQINDLVTAIEEEVVKLRREQRKGAGS